MALLPDTYSADTLPVADRDFAPLPAGWYSCHITSADLRDTKNGTGQYIAVRYDITGPTHEGRVVFGNINIRNASAVAERIGFEQLGKLLRAIGLPKVGDTDELIGYSLQIKLKVREQVGYEPSNDVADFRAADGSRSEAPKPQATAPAAAAPTKPQAAPTKAAPPWAKKQAATDDEIPF